MFIKVVNYILSFFFLLSLSTQDVRAQFEMNPDEIIKMLTGDLNSDRPGQAMTPYTSGMAAIQWQSGFGYQEYLLPDNSQEILFNRNTLRFSLTNKIELNTSFDYERIRLTGLSGIPFDVKGFRNAEIGFRYVFMKGERLRPRLALQSNLSFKSTKGEFQQTNAGSSFYLLSFNKFGRFSITTNLGIVYNGFGGGIENPQFEYALNFGYKLGSKWFLFMEGFGRLDNFGVNVDGGLAFRPNQLLQFDISGARLGLTDFSTPNWFAELGFTWRFSFVKLLAKKKMKDMDFNF